MEEIEKKSKRPRPFRQAVVFALAYQTPIFILASLAPDFGVLGQHVAIALVAFWGGVGILYLRKRKKFSSYDLFMIKAAFIPAIVLTYYVCDKIWCWRGF